MQRSGDRESVGTSEDHLPGLREDRRKLIVHQRAERWIVSRLARVLDVLQADGLGEGSRVFEDLANQDDRSDSARPRAVLSENRGGFPKVVDDGGSINQVTIVYGLARSA